MLITLKSDKYCIQKQFFHNKNHTKITYAKNLQSKIMNINFFEL
jgi:hypothetical protein